MPREQGGVVDDSLVLRQVNDLVGDELGAEGQHVEVDVQRLVLLQDLRHCHLLHLPALVLVYRHILRHRSLGYETVLGRIVLLSQEKSGSQDQQQLQEQRHMYTVHSPIQAYIYIYIYIYIMQCFKLSP